MIGIDDDTAKLLQQRAKQRGLTVQELLKELAALEENAVAADAAHVAELDRRWKAFEAHGSIVSNDDVVRWLQTWGTPAFRSWHKR